jgi:hypothetical protein
MTISQRGVAATETMKTKLFLLILFLAIGTALGDPVTTTESLVAAIRAGAEGSVIEIGPGVYELDAPLELGNGMTLKGAGMNKTVLTHTAGWRPPVDTLPDPEIRLQGIDTQAYLIRLQDKAADITISDLTLRAPQRHGGIFGFGNEHLHLHHLRIEDVLWSGIRTLAMNGAKITSSYAIEFVRSGVEISHNLFDFDLEKDRGNLISAFGKAPAPGPALFHNNLVSNPGRGVIWMNEPYDKLVVRNNHIITRTTVTPRQEGRTGGAWAGFSLHTCRVTIRAQLQNSRFSEQSRAESNLVSCLLRHLRESTERSFHAQSIHQDHRRRSH